MMQPIDHLSELASCCGLRSRRRGYKLPRNYFYSPSTNHLDPGTSWALANPYINPQPQPYILLTQPVIIAGSPSPNHQTNTMTLVQHAQTAPTAANTFPTLSILGPTTHQATMAAPHQSLQPNMISSQYAIYNSSAPMNPNIMAAAPTQTIYESHQTSHNLDDGRSLYFASKQQPQHQPKPMGQLIEASRPQQHERSTVTLNSEVFRQLELIEKQVDLSRDMDFIERHGIVITRALNPYSLMPHLSEDTLKRYHTHFLSSENYVIRFIEVIKRPSQTLGLYIRRVPFEYSHGSREGLVITKIDSDSPVYSSQVLHVGDEILSVNLVDIQGMSLDDVAIIMSIPKRLVLALRIPRDRSELLSLNLMQQQQQQSLRNSIEHQSRESAAAMLSYQQQQQQQQNRSSAAATSLGFRDDQGLKQASAPGLFTLHGREPGLASTLYDHHIDELRREMSRRGLCHQDQRDLNHGQPIQSTLQMNDPIMGGPISSSDEQD